jgi:beta-lactamase class A
MRALAAVLIVLSFTAHAQKVRKHSGPEKLSLYDGAGDLDTDLWGEPDAELQSQVDALLAQRAPFAKALAAEQLSLVLVDLTDPRRLAAAAVRPDWETFPASLGKIAILLGVVNKAHDEHRPDELLTLRPSMDRMIKASSNEDASALFSWAGHASIVAAVARHKLYDEKAGGLWWTPSAPWPKSPKGQLRIAATARQVARYFLMMEQGKLVTPEDSRLIKSVFHNAGLALFSKGIQKRFGDTEYYGKPGILGKEIAEGMLIEAPGARYIVAIVMKGLDKDDPAFQEFGQSLHALMLERGKTRAPPAPPHNESGSWTLTLDGAALALARPDGGAPFVLEPEVHVQLADAASEDAKNAKWERTDGGFTSMLSTPSATWQLEATPAGLDATLTWTRAGDVQSAWLELPVRAKAPKMIDAAYRLRAPPVRADVFTPQVALLDDVTLVGHAQAMSLTATRLRFDADVAAAHPFHLWSECVKEATDKPIVTRPPQVDLSARKVSAGAQLRVSVQLLPGVTSVPVLARWPNGFRAALVLTDHADQANVTRLGALMYGKSTYKAPLAARGGNKGFANRGLTLTKAVFSLPSNGYAAQLEDPRFVELLEALAADGVEVASHSASGDPDTSEKTVEGLALLAKFKPSTWIDHQPTTNCEALTNAGRADTLKALTDAGFRFAWSGDDDHQKDLNLFEPSATKPGAPVLYQHPLTGNLWLFPSRWMALERGEFFERFSQKSLERLERERGLLIAHTYLDIFIEQSGTRLDQWSLLEKIPNGYALSADADEVFARLAKHQKQNALWVTTLRALADHLLAVAAVRWTLDGSEVVFHSATAVKGVTLLEPDGRSQVFDLQAGETRVKWPAVAPSLVVR